MPEAIICLDTGVWIKFLVPEEPREVSEAAVQLVRRVLTADRLVAPAFAWAEVGSVLRKKVRQGLMQAEQADELWRRFGQLPIEYADFPALRERAWKLARRYDLATLYEAAFLACTELVAAPEGTNREFWTADEELIPSLGDGRPPYVHQLGTQEADGRTGAGS